MKRDPLLSLEFLPVPGRNVLALTKRAARSTAFEWQPRLGLVLSRARTIEWNCRHNGIRDARIPGCQDARIPGCRGRMGHITATMLMVNVLQIKIKQDRCQRATCQNAAVNFKCQIN